MCAIIPQIENVVLLYLCVVHVMHWAVREAPITASSVQQCSTKSMQAAWDRGSLKCALCNRVCVDVD